MAFANRFRQGGARDRQRGVAMLEFVMMLPFIWIILVLVFNFGQAFLERHRTLVAVREMAMRHSVEIAIRGGDAPIQPVAARLAQDTLRQRRLSAEFFIDRTPDGECPRRDGEAVDGSFLQDALGAMGSFLEKISSSHSYEVDVRGAAITGRLLRRGEYSACLAIDGNPWTIHETGTPTDWLKSLLGPLGNIL